MPSALTVLADMYAFADGLNQKIGNWTFDRKSAWWQELNEKVEANRKDVNAMAMDKSVPLNYYTVFHHIQEILPSDAIIVSEGANTMDIGRSILSNILPRHRLDAGTFGTMGVSQAFVKQLVTFNGDILSSSCVLFGRWVLALQ